VSVGGAIADHPWERRQPVVWRAAELVAAMVVVGFALVVGFVVPVVLPWALAGAGRVALVRARGGASHPLADVVAGVREDGRAGIAAAVLGACIALPIGLLALAATSTEPSLGAGIRLVLLPVSLLAVAWVIVALLVALATTTPLRRVVPAALALVVARPVRSFAVGPVGIVGLVPTFAGLDPAVASLVAGASFLAAVRVAWPVVARAAAGERGSRPAE